MVLKKCQRCCHSGLFIRNERHISLSTPQEEAHLAGRVCACLFITAPKVIVMLSGVSFVDLSKVVEVDLIGLQKLQQR